MNDPHPPLRPESIRFILIAALVVLLLGGLDSLIIAACVIAVALYSTGWDLARTRAAARSLARTVIGE